MKTPKRIIDLLTERSNYLTLAENNLDKALFKYQEKLLNDYFKIIIPMLEVDASGNLVDSLKNSRLLQTTEKLYQGFLKDNKYKFGEDISGVFDKTASLNDKYFLSTISQTSQTFFGPLAAITKAKINARMGLSGGSIVGGSFLDRLFANDDLIMSLKKFMASAVTGRMKQKDFLSGVNKLITGAGEGEGAYQRQFKRYAHDLFMQYDSAYNSSIATALKMKYFIYQGGLIVDSRDFCVSNNGKVFSKEDTAEWFNWTPAQGEYPEGYKIKQKDINAVPSYLSFAGYTPLIDRGGYNCRHILGWISDELAQKLTKQTQKTESS